jgi:SAM-dependent methyltransferase
MSTPPQDAGMEKQKAEFDAFAADYAGGMDNPLKALAGASGDDFLGVKLDWLLRHVLTPERRRSNFRILDYGCGRGDFLNLMARRGITLDMTGSDISTGMLQEGARHWPKDAPLPRFLAQNGAAVPLADGAVDLIVISSVLHHVAPAERNAVYAELHRLLKPGGEVVVFEHNPLNPVTRYVVAHTPIDANAILLGAGEASAGLTQAGFVAPRCNYIMFAPPRLGALARLVDRLLFWLPLGAQYAVLARKRAGL